MPRIVETIVTTVDGTARRAYRASRSDRGRRRLDHRALQAVAHARQPDQQPFAVASHTDDVRVIAGCVTGRRDWPTVAADRVMGVRLAGAVSHWELEVACVSEDEQRPRFHCRVVHEASHAPWGGYNRAQAAVLELAVLDAALDAAA